MSLYNNITDQEFDIFKRLIYQHTGIHLSQQKKSLLVARLSKRLKALNLKTFMAYYDYLLHHPDRVSEWVKMIDHITTSTTEFFRERQHFVFLQNEALPYFQKKKSNKRLRIWSAGCSTGEEPYTIAIVLSEFFKDREGWDIKILATDVNSQALSSAKAGIYKATSVKPISSPFLKKYFEKESKGDSGLFRVKDTLKQMITFKRLNLIGDHFTLSSIWDIIFCRNVTIYFHPDIKVRVINRFYKLLQNDGFLFMGHAEPLFFVSREFHPVDQSIYQKDLKA